MFVIFGGIRSAATVPTLVALYITGVYWFTSSTSFANPTVKIARAFIDTFAGIAPQHVFAYIVAQLVAVLLSDPTLHWLFAQKLT